MNRNMMFTLTLCTFALIGCRQNQKGPSAATPSPAPQKALPFKGLEYKNPVSFDDLYRAASLELCSKLPPDRKVPVGPSYAVEEILLELPETKAYAEKARALNATMADSLLSQWLDKNHARLSKMAVAPTVSKFYEPYIGKDVYFIPGLTSAYYDLDKGTFSVYCGHGYSDAIEGEEKFTPSDFTFKVTIQDLKKLTNHGWNNAPAVISPFGIGLHNVRPDRTVDSVFIYDPKSGDKVLEIDKQSMVKKSSGGIRIASK